MPAYPSPPFAIAATLPGPMRCKYARASAGHICAMYPARSLLQQLDLRGSSRPIGWVVTSSWEKGPYLFSSQHTGGCKWAQALAWEQQITMISQVLVRLTLLPAAITCSRACRLCLLLTTSAAADVQVAQALPQVTGKEV